MSEEGIGDVFYMERLKNTARKAKEIQPGVHLGEQALVFDEIAQIAVIFSIDRLLCSK